MTRESGSAEAARFEAATALVTQDDGAQASLDMCAESVLPTSAAARVVGA